jgi:zinc/manganese transport system substrate-binding protein
MGRKDPSRKDRLVVLLSALTVVVAAGCSGAATTASPDGACSPPRLVVTTSILGDIVSSIVGDEGSVEVLMPVGADPHSYQASARQAAAMRDADLVVVNGLGLEEGMQDVIEAARGDGATVVEAASFIEPLPFAQVAGAHDGEVAGGEGHEAGTLDPHIWTDPRRMADVVSGLGEALAAADPACPGRWRAAAEAYRQELLALDSEIEAILNAVPAEQRKLVTNHAAFGYFADRYDFEVVGVIIPGGSTLAEPSPADLALLVEVLRREGVRTVFAETTQPADLAEALAAELREGVAVVSLYTGSLGEPGSGADTYVGMERTNAERIAAALSP